MTEAEITYELTAEDFLQFGREIGKTQSQYKPTVIILAIIYFLFIFSDIIFAFFSGPLSNWDFGLIALNIFIRTLLTFAVVFIVLGVVKLEAGKKLKDATAEKENGLLCEHKIILTEKELVEITDVNSSRYAWKAVGEIKELESFVTIDILLSFTYIIPKRYFEDGREIKNFIDTAETYKQNSLNSYSPSYFAMLDEKSDML